MTPQRIFFAFPFVCYCVSFLALFLFHHESSGAWGCGSCPSFQGNYTIKNQTRLIKNETRLVKSHCGVAVFSSRPPPQKSKFLCWLILLSAPAIIPFFMLMWIIFCTLKLPRTRSTFSYQEIALPQK